LSRHHDRAAGNIQDDSNDPGRLLRRKVEKRSGIIGKVVLSFAPGRHGAVSPMQITQALTEKSSVSSQLLTRREQRVREKAEAGLGTFVDCE
jgi:hypothetical protein